MKDHAFKKRKIRGTVFPAAWDEDRNVIQVVVDTPDQDGYFIDPVGKGRELFDCIRREVEVSGTLREDDDGNYIIKVKEYCVVESFWDLEGGAPRPA